jgi:ABC-2 type transport system ATP-binding protein
MVIIDEGKKLYDGGLRAVMETYARDRTMHISTVSAPTSLASIATRIPLAKVSEGKSALEFNVSFDPSVVTAGEVLVAVQAEADVADLRIDEPAIEDVVRKVYAHELKPGVEPGAHADGSS